MDDVDYDRVIAHPRPWHAYLHHGVWRAKDWAGLSMHRLVVGAEPGQQVDHVNRDGLDNRRANLRLATNGQNRANSRSASASGYKGVYRVPNKGVYRTTDKWRAQIRAGGRIIHLGYFGDAETAARAYDAAAREYFGEFARGNF